MSGAALNMGYSDVSINTRPGSLVNGMMEMITKSFMIVFGGKPTGLNVLTRAHRW